MCAWCGVKCVCMVWSEVCAWCGVKCVCTVQSEVCVEYV